VKGADAGAAALLGGAPSFEAQFRQRQTLTKRDPSQETPADKNRQQGRFIAVLLDSLRQDFRRDERLHIRGRWRVLGDGERVAARRTAAWRSK
jgi:hypothetical protein